MVKKEYIPARGDIVLLQFAPQAGREQSGKRPAVVLSPKEYNAKVGLAVFCPITSQQKGYPFEVPLPKSCETQGVVLADHVKNLDWKARNSVFLEKLPSKQLEAVLHKTRLLLL